MKSFAALVALVCLLAQTESAKGYLIEDFYHPVGTSEDLVAMLNHSIEATTESAYNELVLLEVSNFGWNNPQEAFDGFYFFLNTRQVEWTPIAQGLSVAFDGNTFLTGPSWLLSNDPGYFQIVFNEDVGECSGLNIHCLPHYREDHSYRLVVNFLLDQPRVLNFGFADGGTYDNTGQFEIRVTPVALGAIPEPSTALLMLCGLSILCRRRLILSTNDKKARLSAESSGLLLI